MTRIQFKNLFTSPTGRLAESYLLVIMLMSIGFSMVFYNVSSYQLGRQLPPDDMIQREAATATTHPPDSADVDYYHDSDDIGQFLHNRISQGITSLRFRLLYLNIGTLVLGAIVSYLLARRTLRPIEQAMETQIQFVNDASHELRTPLTAILTSNDVALRNSKLQLHSAKQVIKQNSEDIQRLKTLSDSLLSLARNEKMNLKYTNVELQTVVSNAITHIVPQAAAKNISVHDEVAAVNILGNKVALEQVIIILLDNAVKYSNRKSNIFVKTRRKGKYIYLDVIDQGIGIRASDINHIFRRFYRADHSRSGGERSGYGLGLSIAKRIMLNHNSSLSVTSIIGEGSTFTIKLKLVL